MQLLPSHNKRTPHSLSLRDAVNQVFNESFWDPFDILSPMYHTAIIRNAFIPNADISETDSEIKLLLDIPGYDPSDITVEVQNNILFISGLKNETVDKEQESEMWYKKERLHGSFQRQFSLPSEINEDDITCKFKHGTLRIIIPKMAIQEDVSNVKTVEIELE
jgi:HSP20 family protein